MDEKPAIREPAGALVSDYRELIDTDISGYHPVTSKNRAEIVQYARQGGPRIMLGMEEFERHKRRVLSHPLP